MDRSVAVQCHHGGFLSSSCTSAAPAWRTSPRRSNLTPRTPVKSVLSSQPLRGSRFGLRQQAPLGAVLGLPGKPKTARLLPGSATASADQAPPFGLPTAAGKNFSDARPLYDLIGVLQDEKFIRHFVAEAVIVLSLVYPLVLFWSDTRTIFVKYLLFYITSTLFVFNPAHVIFNNYHLDHAIAAVCWSLGYVVFAGAGGIQQMLAGPRDILFNLFVGMSAFIGISIPMTQAMLHGIWPIKAKGIPPLTGATPA